MSLKRRSGDYSGEAMRERDDQGEHSFGVCQSLGSTVLVAKRSLRFARPHTIETVLRMKEEQKGVEGKLSEFNFNYYRRVNRQGVESNFRYSRQLDFQVQVRWEEYCKGLELHMSYKSSHSDAIQRYTIVRCEPKNYSDSHLRSALSQYVLQ